MTLINEFYGPFSRLGEDFKSYVNQLMSIRDLFSWKTTEYVVYDVVRSYE